MAGIGGGIAGPKTGNVFDDIQQMLNSAKADTGTIMGDVGKGVEALVPEDVVVVGGEVSAGLEILSWVALGLVIDVILDAIAILLWWIRGITGKIPFVGKLFTVGIDYILGALATTIEPINEYINTMVRGAGSAILSLFGILGAAHHFTRKSDVAHGIAKATHPIHSANANLDKRLRNIEQQIQTQTASVQTEVHGIYSRITEIDQHVAKLDHRVTETMKAVAVLSKAVEVNTHHIAQLQREVIKLDHIAYTHMVRLDHHDKQIHQLQVGLFGLMVRVTHDEKLLEPAAAAAGAMGPIGPLIGLGQDGIECLVRQGRDCGRSHLHPHVEKCWTDSLFPMLARFHHAEPG